MMFYDLSQQELEKLRNTDIKELGLSTRAYSLLKRAGYDTLEELLHITVEELQSVTASRKRAEDEVMRKLAERNLVIPTQEEKQHILAETDQPEILKKEISLLEQRSEKQKSYIHKMTQEKKDEYEKKSEALRKTREQALKEARGIVNTSERPMARLLESMYFGQSAYEGCSFCNIFDLWDKGCLLEEEEKVQHSCEECIDKFLADYYWKEYLSEKLKREEGKVQKVMRIKTSFLGGLQGTCPVCQRTLMYDKEEHFCSRCGCQLDWDEENWDEKTRDYMMNDRMDDVEE